MRKDLLSWQAMETAASVTKSNMDEYNRLGVTKVSNGISTEWVDLLRDGCDIAQVEVGTFAEYLNQLTDAGIFFTDLELAQRLPLFAAFSMYSPMAAVARTLMGSQTSVKGDQLASVFVPLDKVVLKDGLQFVAGLHHWLLQNPQHFADGTQYSGSSLPADGKFWDRPGEGAMPTLDVHLQEGQSLGANPRAFPATWHSQS
jgi:hypothetical protein